MPIQGLDPERCRRRNRLAARRGFDATPVRLYAGPPGAPSGLTPVTARGTLPATPAEALDRINKLLGRERRPLSESDVYLVYPELANTNFIADRWFFLDPSTLRNFAREAQDGFAFMNSHRTGGMSVPAELPYGRTFAGRFEQLVDPEGRTFGRTLIGAYMLRGAKPNGDAGPSTDEIFRGIDGGTIVDVSVGFYGGTKVCDVCGAELGAFDPETGDYACPHVPGTHRRMTADEADAQKTRGVPGGEATYSVVDAHAGEFSAVFDGAVPGAGFHKALHLARRHQLSRSDADEAGRAFAALARPGDFTPRSLTSPDPGRVRTRLGVLIPKGTDMPQKINVAEAFRFWKALGQPAELGLEELHEALEHAADGADRAELRHGEDAGEPGSPSAHAEAESAPALAPAPVSRPTGSTAPSKSATEMAALHQQVALLNDQLKAEREQREMEVKEARDRAIRADAAAFADIEIRACRATPAERQDLTSEFIQASKDDYKNPEQIPYRDPKDQTAKLGSRVDALRARQARRPVLRHGEEHISSNPADRARAQASLATLPAEEEPFDSLGFVESQARRWAERRNGKASRRVKE